MIDFIKKYDLGTCYVRFYILHDPDLRLFLMTPLFLMPPTLYYMIRVCNVIPFYNKHVFCIHKICCNKCQFTYHTYVVSISSLNTIHPLITRPHLPVSWSLRVHDHYVYVLVAVLLLVATHPMGVSLLTALAPSLLVLPEFCILPIALAFMTNGFCDVLN